jgi:hypothetical protein
VDEVAEDRQGAYFCVFDGERDGVADAETHAEVRGPENSHQRTIPQRTLYAKVTAEFCKQRPSFQLEPPVVGAGGGRTSRSPA